MAIPIFEVDMDIISKLGEHPLSDDGLTPESFKATFDLAGKYIKEYINTILVPNLNSIVDVQALLDNILDESLTQADKAAPAKYVGDLIRSLSTQFNINQADFFKKTVQKGDYVIGTDQKFNAYMLDNDTVRVFGGEAVLQGHVVSMNIGRYQDFNISPGIYGTYRNDLICLRYHRDIDGKESTSLVVLEGEAKQTGAEDPVRNTDNINVIGNVTCDLPLYRVKVIGVDITIEKIIPVYESLVDAVIAQLSVWEGGSY